MEAATDLQEGSHARAPDEAEESSDLEDSPCFEETLSRERSRLEDAQSCHRLRQLSIHSMEVSALRGWSAAIIYSRRLEILSGVITLISFVLILVDTDIRAKGLNAPFALSLSNLLCWAFFVAELTLRTFVERHKVLRDNWNVLDIVVVASGFIQIAVDAFGSTFGAANAIRAQRCLRSLRLLRIFRAFSLLGHSKHLRSIVRSIGVCFKILFWSSFIIFIFVTMWATWAVELILPLMQEVSEKTSAWDDCTRCTNSFDSIMSANLTLFQTIIAGDSWGLVAIPVIEEYPAAAIIFIGSTLTISLGILNLVVAVLVDASAEARASDVEMRANDAKRTERALKGSLTKLVRLLDADGSGALSFAELEEGVEKVKELHNIMAAMDIHHNELRQLFDIIDYECTDEVRPEQIIDILYRMKCGDNRTAAMFVKHHVAHLAKKQQAMFDTLGTVEAQLQRLTRVIEGDKRKSRNSQTKEPKRATVSAIEGSHDMANWNITNSGHDSPCASANTGMRLSISSTQSPQRLNSPPGGAKLHSSSSLDLRPIYENKKFSEPRSVFGPLTNLMGQAGGELCESSDQLKGIIAQAGSKLSSNLHAQVDSQLKGIEACMLEIFQEFHSMQGKIYTEVASTVDRPKQNKYDHSNTSEEQHLNPVVLGSRLRSSPSASSVDGMRLRSMSQSSLEPKFARNGETKDQEEQRFRKI